MKQLLLILLIFCAAPRAGLDWYFGAGACVPSGGEFDRVYRPGLRAQAGLDSIVTSSHSYGASLGISRVVSGVNEARWKSGESSTLLDLMANARLFMTLGGEAPLYLTLGAAAGLEGFLRTSYGEGQFRLVPVFSPELAVVVPISLPSDDEMEMRFGASWHRTLFIDRGRPEFSALMFSFVRHFAWP